MTELREILREAFEPGELAGHDAAELSVLFVGEQAAIEVERFDG